jgi:hypothetical protein
MSIQNLMKLIDDVY